MIRPITDTLRHIGGGEFVDVASDKLAELVTAVDSTGKAGKLDLTITVKKASRIRADKVLEAAANAIVQKIADPTRKPIFYGTAFA